MIQTPTRPVSSQSISRTPGSTNDFKLEVGMSVFCNNELGELNSRNLDFFLYCLVNAQIFF